MTTPDVERVAAEVERAARKHWLTKPSSISTYEAVARAAMAATREIDAEDLRDVAEEWPYLSAEENKRRETMLSIAADWLQQRADRVKETGRG